jgi:uncharacterized protein (DUF433 family)
LILVVGATGDLGFEVCSRLRQDGRVVRALVRDGSAREGALGKIGVEEVYGDLKDVESLERASAGSHTIVSTATSTTSRRRGDTLQAVDRNGQISLVKAARDAGVRRFVYVSIGPNASPRSQLVVCKKRSGGLPARRQPRLGHSATLGVHGPLAGVDPEIMGGTAVFVGTRVPFETLLDYLKGGQPVSESLEDFPTVTQEQVFAALEQAKEALLARVHSA